ncbi:hypothetical protein K523DRAFT_43526 [Schizophyllum commune Tattone D]|nr:hypothetical protein K523DRAFT_43526 [Schizophyllum commune Tattone D]
MDISFTTPSVLTRSLPLRPFRLLSPHLALVCAPTLLWLDRRLSRRITLVIVRLFPSVYICLARISYLLVPPRGCSSVGLVRPRILLYYHSAPSWTCSTGGILSLHPAGWRAGGAGPG